MATKKKTKSTTKKGSAKKRAPRSPAHRKARRGQKRGKPPFKPTQDQRKQVEMLVGLQLTYAEIATVTLNPDTGDGISTRTLQDHFPKELAQGQARVKASVVGSLVAKATSKTHPQSAICAMFICKCRYGWRQEDKHVLEVDGGSVGVLVAPAMMDPASWIAEQRRLNETKVSPEQNGNDDGARGRT